MMHLAFDLLYVDISDDVSQSVLFVPLLSCDAQLVFQREL